MSLVGLDVEVLEELAELLKTEEFSLLSNREIPVIILVNLDTLDVLGLHYK